MKKQSPSSLIIFFLAVLLVAAAIFLTYRHFVNNPVAGNSSSAAGSAAAGSASMQTFSGDGYAFAVPASWYVEQNGRDAVSAYPDHAAAASSSAPSCKIAMSVFPYAQDASEADWIAGRIGADPSLAVVEQSSEDVAVSGGSGVKWIGTIDGAPTTLVYAFSNDHAYEIAPSVINETSLGNAGCTDDLQTFISQLTIQ